MDCNKKTNSKGSYSNKNQSPGEYKFFRLSPEDFGAKLTKHYSEVLGHDITATKTVPLFSVEKINKILKDIFKGSTDVPEVIFKDTYAHLSKGLETGYGSIDTPNDAMMVYQLKNNVAVFAAFKANHYASAMRSLLVDESGNKRTYSDFRKEAIKIDSKYNQLWLAAEYNLATRQARTAEQWQKFKRDQDIYPNLEYMPSRSPNPRDSHIKFYGLILPIDDPFWDTFLPPNGFNCKCWVRQSRADATNERIDAPESVPGIEGNPGKTGRVISASHPFITAVKKEDKKALKLVFSKYRSNLEDMIELKVGKNSTIISSNAFAGDLLQNIKFAQLVAKKYKSDIFINAHSEVSKIKNPEYSLKNIIGDLVSIKGTNLKRSISSGFSDKVGKDGQMRDLDKCWIAFDFGNKISNDNVKDVADQFYPKLQKYQNVKFIILKIGDKMLEIKNSDKITNSEILLKIKAELKE